MKRRILRRLAARLDLIEHYLHIGERSPDAAERFRIAIEEALKRLRDNPALGKRWDTENQQLAGLRSWVVPRFRNYIIFYRPSDDGIELVRVLHGARDIRAALGDEDEA